MQACMAVCGWTGQVQEVWPVPPAEWQGDENTDRANTFKVTYWVECQPIFRKGVFGVKGIRLLTVDTTVLPSEKDEYARACVMGIRKLQEEAAHLAALPVPASFTGRIPDTQEAAAARRQVEITQGKFPMPGVTL